MGNSNDINQNFAKIKVILESLNDTKNLDSIINEFIKETSELKSEFNKEFKTFSKITNKGKCSQKYKSNTKKIHDWYQIYKKDIELAIKKDISAKQKTKDIIISNTEQLDSFGLQAEYIYDFIEVKLPMYFETFQSQLINLNEFDKVKKLVSGYETTLADTKSDELNAEDESIDIDLSDFDDYTEINNTTEINPVKTTLNIRKTLETLNGYIAKVKQSIKNILDINLKLYNYKQSVYSLLSNEAYDSYKDVDHQEILMLFQEKLNAKNYRTKYLFVLLSHTNRLIKQNSLFNRRAEYFDLLKQSMQFLPKKITDKIHSRLFPKPIDALIENAPNVKPQRKDIPEPERTKSNLPSKYFGPNAGTPISDVEKRKIMERLEKQDHQEEIARVLKRLEEQEAITTPKEEDNKLSVAKQLMLNLLWK